MCEQLSTFTPTSTLTLKRPGSLGSLGFLDSRSKLRSPSYPLTSRNTSLCCFSVQCSNGGVCPRILTVACDRNFPLTKAKKNGLGHIDSVFQCRRGFKPKRTQEFDSASELSRFAFRVPSSMDPATPPLTFPQPAAAAGEM